MQLRRLLPLFPPFTLTRRFVTKPSFAQLPVLDHPKDQSPA